MVGGFLRFGPQFCSQSRSGSNKPRRCQGHAQGAQRVDENCSASDFRGRQFIACEHLHVIAGSLPDLQAIQMACILLTYHYRSIQTKPKIDKLYN